jgi:hypothetical protein
MPRSRLKAVNQEVVTTYLACVKTRSVNCHRLKKEVGSSRGHKLNRSHTVIYKPQNDPAMVDRLDCFVAGHGRQCPAVLPASMY